MHTHPLWRMRIVADVNPLYFHTSAHTTRAASAGCTPNRREDDDRTVLVASSAILCGVMGVCKVIHARQ